MIPQNHKQTNKLKYLHLAQHEIPQRIWNKNETRILKDKKKKKIEKNENEKQKWKTKKKKKWKK